MVKYHGFEISGTSGRTMNPNRAIGREMTPSIRNSLPRSVS